MSSVCFFVFFLMFLFIYLVSLGLSCGTRLVVVYGIWVSLVAPLVKNLPGDLGSIPWLGGSPGEGHGNPHQYSSVENHYKQRSLVSYSPWGHKESGLSN